MATIKLPSPTPDQEAYLRKIQEHADRGYDPTVMVGGPRCMYEDQSMDELQYRPRSDGSPGREAECRTCGGVWALGIGGRPSQCNRVR